MKAVRAPFLLPRAAGVALTALVLAAAAHVLAGGELPALPVLSALAAVVTLTAVVLAGRKMTTPVLAAYLGICQAALHLAFSALSGPGTPVNDLSGHHPAAPGPGPGGGGVPGVHDHLSADMSAGMLAMHVAAVLATALVMAKGEAAVWALASWLRPLVEPPAAVSIRTPHFVVQADADLLRLRPGRPERPPARGPPRPAAAFTP
ncbi:hypothetical protein [Paenarthrobacter sp. YJN-5]|uniref:hypothetical protein n=1 Tax=Paenarthrobacter sp. YJN-5 TaxID=2735316 RepID=UPI0018785816|nr:hypothetical protein [Paenarthrobacter sp. YJN-5]QOT20000.1 hypothetical protein HMI59_25465 [Paenarthrobacter sp. YJN-5]